MDPTQNVPKSCDMTTVPDAPVILWFRNDLRLADQAALLAAVETGRPVLPVFVLDDDSPGPWALGGASRWWLHYSLKSLQDSLWRRGSQLTLRCGDSVRIIAEIAATAGAAEVFTGGSAEPWSRRVDEAASKAIGVKLHRMRTTTIFHPDLVRTKGGGAYSVFTPFANACLALGGPKQPAPAPKHIRPADPQPSDRLDDWALLPTKPDWASGLRDTWTPGEAGAMERAEAFLTRGLHGYAAGRDQPGGDATSMLSPHLHFGEISACQLWHLAHQRPGGEDRETFIRELLWREFCANLLWHNPGLPEAPLKPEFANMP
jgi:deoxyribodipyrimidine photo-lyase